MESRPDRLSPDSPENGSTRRQFLGRTAILGLSVTALGTLAACGGSSSTTASPSASQAIKKGGRLTIAYVGGGSAETLDPSLYVGTIDHARGWNLYDHLCRINGNLELEMDLAESMESNAKADEWTIRLKDGVTWHDGSPLTVDDLLFTINRVAAPDSTSAGASTLRLMDTKAAKKLDSLTVRIPLTRPFANVPAFFVDFWMPILKNGTKDFNKPIGTGAFMFKEWSPGRSSLFVKNPNYWRTGQPYVDELEFVSIGDSNARLNALLSGQVHAMEALSFTQAKQQESQGQINVLIGNGPINTPMAMSVTAKPFDDVRVRQAFRLLADRPQLVQNVQLGYGSIGNDLYGKGLSFYDEQLSQRARDVEQAKALLKQAGAEGITVPIATSTVAQGMLESATLFSQQAKEAGITVTVDQKPPDSYWSDGYMKSAFFQTVWLATPIEVWTQQALFKGGIWNETSWNDPAFEKRVMDAQSTLDSASAADQWNQIQNTLWETGGYIFWGFYPWLDGVSKKVQGAKGNGFLQLGGNIFRDWSLTA
jgi:peptide/nickel transport system substrate-binding protein